MTVKKIALAALGATFLVGAMAPVSFAAPGRPDHGPEGRGPRGAMMQELMFVRLLKNADTNKDGKITKDEITAFETKLFDAADANKDGVLTPGEVRKYQEARMEEWREKRKAERADAGDDEPEDMAEAPDAPPPPPPPGPEGKGPMEHGPKGGPKGGPGDMADRGPEGGPPRGPGMGMRHGMGHGMMGMGAMFRFADTDENGQISKEEATAAVNKLFDRMDRNKDGVISIDDMPDGPF